LDSGILKNEKMPAEKTAGILNLQQKVIIKCRGGYYPPVFMPTVGNGLDRSAGRPIYCRAGALLPPQTGNPEGSLPRGGCGFFAEGEKDGRGITKNPEGSLICVKGGVTAGDGGREILSS